LIGVGPRAHECYAAPQRIRETAELDVVRQRSLASVAALGGRA